MEFIIIFLAIVGLPSRASPSRISLPDDGPPIFGPATVSPQHSGPELQPELLDLFPSPENFKQTSISEKQGGSCECGLKGGRNRIVGGTKARSGEFPWRVRVVSNVTYKRKLDEFYCGGTIIHKRWVLTAAHCFEKVKLHNVDILVGDVSTKKAKKIRCKNPIIHEGRNEDTKQDDIALLRVSEDLDFSKPNIGLACLPYQLRGNTEWTGKVTASGWGDTEEDGSDSETLLKVVLDAIGNKRCKKEKTDYKYLSSSQMCTFTPDKDVCDGDSGGSIDYTAKDGKSYAVGVVSFGSGCAKTPGVYARVSEYIEWIEKNTRVKFCRG